MQNDLNNMIQMKWRTIMLSYNYLSIVFVIILVNKYSITEACHRMPLKLKALIEFI